MGVSDNKFAQQNDFFNKLGYQQPLSKLFDYLPGTYLFVKDAEGRFMQASQSTVEHLGFHHEEEIIGLTDFDVFPQQMADNYINDDRIVMETGQPLIGRIEVWYNEQGILDWFVTNKMPLHDLSGNIVGLMGTIQSYDDKQNLLMPFFELTEVVEYIRSHYKEKITVEQLAKVAHLSPRQLRRKFRNVFSMSMQEFLMKTRLQATCESLIHSNDSILEIALQFGFCNQSTFTEYFRKYLGLTPLKYRQKYARNRESR